ncbi:glycosyltransferase [Microbacterium sp.]|uniref:glycosyltransferase n=1 Tax=Microbacterium sp. TaxID=51671 RepID=UPI0039E57F21
MRPTVQTPVLLRAEELPEDPADVVYLTKYVGRLDSGIAFTDTFYLDGLARSALSTLVMANRVPVDLGERLLTTSSSDAVYRRQRPLLQLSNGLGSFRHHAPGGPLPEHEGALRVVVVHDEPAAYDHYGTDVWNRDNVVGRLMPAHDAYIFVSENCRAAWNAYPHIAAKPQFFLPNTCAEEPLISTLMSSRRRQDVRRELGYRDDEVNICVVATVQPRKAQRTAIEAIARLCSEDPDRRYRLRLFGRATQPDYLAELRAEVARLGVAELVTFAGQLPKAEVLEHIFASDALVCPSESEAMPLVLLEAMQLQTPILTTPVGGITEMVDDASARLFAPGDAAGLSAALRRSASEPAETATRVAAAAERYGAEFSQARFRERFDAVLRELVRLASHGGKGTPAHLGGDLGAFLDGQERRRARIALALADPAAWSPTTRVFAADGGLVPALRTAAPALRLGYRPVGIDESSGALRLSRAPETPAILAAREVAALLHSDAHVEAVATDVAAHAARERRTLLRTIRGLRRTVRRKDAVWIGGRLRRALRRIPGLTRVARGWRAWRRGVPTTGAPTGASSDAIVFVVNSPTQLVTGLALWDQVYSSPGAPPLAALVYSTGGASDFGARVKDLAERTGRFARVVDVTDTYRRVYGRDPGTDDLRRVQRAFRAHLGPFRAARVFIPAFMSARAQKVLYETFDGASVHLFEDGLGSYVPKPIKMVDDGLRDRVLSGDCAEAFHIRRIATVDLLWDALPAPPQYGAELPGVRFPEVHVGRFRPDFSAVVDAWGAAPRAFSPDTVLVTTQNFADHLRHAGLTREVERGLNDAMIARLVDSGARVVVRPHPRASEDVWSERWSSDPRVEIWREHPGVPVEALLAPSALPAAVVGVSSSCLFTLAGRPDLSVRRFPDAAYATLGRFSTPEYREMLELARVAVEPWSSPEPAADGPQHPSGRVQAALSESRP